jgi:drug/metabolite transporter (DMT)-like permease
MNSGLFGGIAGCVIGVIGGLIGTYASIRNTSSSRERTFTVKASIIAWIVAVIFIILLLILPGPWRFALWLPYGILLPVGIITLNRTQQKIRDEESQNQQVDGTR